MTKWGIPVVGSVDEPPRGRVVDALTDGIPLEQRQRARPRVVVPLARARAI